MHLRLRDFERLPPSPGRSRPRLIANTLGPIRKLSRQSHLHALEPERLRHPATAPMMPIFPQDRMIVKGDSQSASMSLPSETDEWEQTDEDPVSASEAENEIVIMR